MSEFQRIRPFKVLAVIMLTIAVVLTVVSLVGPDWVSAAYYEGKIQSWGLWWDCLKVHTSFEMCVGADWLAGCAAMVFISLITDVVATALGVWGLFAKRRLPYVLAGGLSILSAVCQTISVIVYPIMFTKEIYSIDSICGISLAQKNYGVTLCWSSFFVSFPQSVGSLTRQTLKASLQFVSSLGLYAIVSHLLRANSMAF